MGRMKMKTIEISMETLIEMRLEESKSFIKKKLEDAGFDMTKHISMNIKHSDHAVVYTQKE
jgi:hypothetical protein